MALLEPESGAVSCLCQSGLMGPACEPGWPVWRERLWALGRRVLLFLLGLTTYLGADRLPCCPPPGWRRGTLGSPLMPDSSSHRQPPAPLCRVMQSGVSLVYFSCSFLSASPSVKHTRTRAHIPAGFSAWGPLAWQCLPHPSPPRPTLQLWVVWSQLARVSPPSKQLSGLSHPRLSGPEGAGRGERGVSQAPLLPALGGSPRPGGVWANHRLGIAPEQQFGARPLIHKHVLVRAARFVTVLLYGPQGRRPITAG